MKLNQYLDEDELRFYVNEGYVSCEKHPTEDIYIYNYTKRAQYEGKWNSTVNKCRGLIVCSDGTIMSRPFEKFFNYEELDPETVPNLPFQATEKLDGSLGILYWIDDVPYMATRGSFVSEQALHATELLHTKYKETYDRLDRSKTYLFEIIYPENHIVVNYGSEDDIFLLTVIDNETGDETDTDEYSDIFRCTRKYDGVTDFRKIRDMFDGDNKEGFVIRFSNNFRVKLKFAEYFRLHSLLCGLSEKKILDMISSGNRVEIEKVINSLDEENRIMYDKVLNDFLAQYNDILMECTDIVPSIPENDKDAAFYILGNHKRLSAPLFKLRKNQDCSAAIWRIIKNEFKETRRRSIDDE